MLKPLTTVIAALTVLVLATPALTRPSFKHDVESFFHPTGPSRTGAENLLVLEVPNEAPCNADICPRSTVPLDQLARAYVYLKALRTKLVVITLPVERLPLSDLDLFAKLLHAIPTVLVQFQDSENTLQPLPEAVSKALVEHIGLELPKQNNTLYELNSPVPLLKPLRDYFDYTIPEPSPAAVLDPGAELDSLPLESFAAHDSIIAVKNDTSRVAFIGEEKRSVVLFGQKGAISSAQFLAKIAENLIGQAWLGHAGWFEYLIITPVVVLLAYAVSSYTLSEAVILVVTGLIGFYLIGYLCLSRLSCLLPGSSVFPIFLPLVLLARVVWTYGFRGTRSNVKRIAD